MQDGPTVFEGKRSRSKRRLTPYPFLQGRIDFIELIYVLGMSSWVVRNAPQRVCTSFQFACNAFQIETICINPIQNLRKALRVSAQTLPDSRFPFQLQTAFASYANRGDKRFVPIGLRHTMEANRP